MAVQVDMTASAPTGMRPRALDHVAVRTDRREEVTALLTKLGLRELEGDDQSCLLGCEPAAGKLWLLDADGPVAQGALCRLVFGVASVDDAVADLPQEADVARVATGVDLTAPGGLPLGLVHDSTGPACDLDHLVLRARRPAQVTGALLRLGLEGVGDRFVVGNRAIRVVGGEPGNGGVDMLSHIGLLVSSASAWLDEAHRLDMVSTVMDTPRGYSVLLKGPENLSIELLERSARDDTEPE